MQKLSKKETILRERDEAERAIEYARKQRRQYQLRFGILAPLFITLMKYLVLARLVLAVFFTGYIMGKKECTECPFITPCELPKTGA